MARRKHSERQLSGKRDELLTEIEGATDTMPLAQAKTFLLELVDDINLKIDVINAGEVD
jgi:hypothetical protein